MSASSWSAREQSSDSRFVRVVLTALIEEGHHHVDPFCLSGSGRNNTLQILKMIIRRHMVYLPAYGVSQAVIADIYQDIKICSPNRIVKLPFAFPGTETGTAAVQKVGVSHVSGGRSNVFCSLTRFFSGLCQMRVHCRGKFAAALQKRRFLMVPQAKCVLIYRSQTCSSSVLLIVSAFLQILSYIILQGTRQGQQEK